MLIYKIYGSTMFGLTRLITGIFMLVFLHFSFQAYSQAQHQIKVFFLYGSRPAPHFKKTEKHYFGGIHGGHVSIKVGRSVVSFHHIHGYHIFPHHSGLRGTYQRITLKKFADDTATDKYVTFEIPLDSLQWVRLQSDISRNLRETPYDYAFFGMRCAAAAYDMLSHAGVFRKRSRLGMICSNFYPKLLRRKCFKLAKQDHYTILYQQGRKSRIWEKD